MEKYIIKKDLSLPQSKPNVEKKKQWNEGSPEIPHDEKLSASEFNLVVDAFEFKADVNSVKEELDKKQINLSIEQTEVINSNPYTNVEKQTVEENKNDIIKTVEEIVKSNYLIELNKKEIANNLEEIEIIKLINVDVRKDIDTNLESIEKNINSINNNEVNIEVNRDAIDQSDGQIEKNANDINSNAELIINNGNEIINNKDNISSNINKINGLGTDKQNAKLNYKQLLGEDVTVEQQIEINEKENEAAKTREDNFLKKDDGEMSSGYNASTPKDVVVKETFDNEKTSKDKDIANIVDELAKKADVADLGQSLLIYIPGQGIDPNATTVPIVPTIVTGTNAGLLYSMPADFPIWIAAQKDSDGDLLIHNGNKSEIYIKDATSTTYHGIESYNNGSSTKNTFGTDADAEWNLSDTQLFISTNNSNRQIERTIRQVEFIVNPTAGSGNDTVARDDIAKLKTEKQDKIINLTGLPNTVEDALVQNKNSAKTNADIITGISYDEHNITTNISDNLEVAETLNAKKITEDGKEVALKEEILGIITVDENNTTVKETKDAIISTLLDQEGRKSVLFEHAEGNQKALTFVGYVEKVTVDPIEGGVAYYGESAFNKFTNIDDHEPYIYQLFLNIKGWQAWQATLATTDQKYKSDYATTTQATLDTYAIFFARREASLKVANENVLTDSEEQISLNALEALVNSGLGGTVINNAITNPAPPEDDDDFMVNEINRFGGGIDD